MLFMIRNASGMQKPPRLFKLRGFAGGCGVSG